MRAYDSRSGDLQAQRVPFEPPEPTSIEETGLNLGFLADLALKTIYFGGYISGHDLVAKMKLPYYGVLDRVLEFLRREQLCEVKGARGVGEVSFRYTLTGKGSERARQVLALNQYVGPAPVTLSAYTAAVRKQARPRITLHPATLHRALSHLVLSEDILNQIGPAVNSGRSIFIFGPPGNGKTAIAESIGRLISQGQMYIPHAVAVDSHVIKVFDGVNHVPVKEEKRGLDQRWIKIRRPVIITGGELVLESLELAYDDISKCYEAPLQMKANGGMLLIDDFGRQRVRPRDLLNRWIVPLEKGVDYLTLHTGRKIEVPFNALIVFATNITPRELVDEAFLRRIPHKIQVQDPSPDEYREIFRRVCAEKNIPYHEEALNYLLQEHYIKPRRKMRACHPRDILERLVELAWYLGVTPRLTKELIDRACRAYFVEM